MLRTLSRQPLTPGLVGITRQTAFERGVGGRPDPDLLQHPSRVLLAGRLDDPGQHQLAKHLIALRGRIEAEHVVGAAQGLPQVRHPRGGDLQRTRPGVSLQAKVQLALILSEPLPGRSLQRFELRLVVCRPKVLDIAGTTPGGVHDLDRGRPGRGLHRADVRHERPLYGPD